MFKTTASQQYNSTLTFIIPYFNRPFEFLLTHSLNTCLQHNVTITTIILYCKRVKHIETMGNASLITPFENERKQYAVIPTKITRLNSNNTNSNDSNKASPQVYLRNQTDIF